MLAIKFPILFILNLYFAKQSKNVIHVFAQDAMNEHEFAQDVMNEHEYALDVMNEHKYAEFLNRSYFKIVKTIIKQGSQLSLFFYSEIPHLYQKFRK